MDLENMYEVLKENGFIDYGKTIPKHMIEGVVGISQDNKDPWKFLNPFLKLKEFIEEHGYFCRCDNGSMRILQLEEMTKKCKRIEKNFLKRQQRAVITMRNAEIDLLEERLQRNHYHSLNNMNMLLHSSRNILNSV